MAVDLEAKREYQRKWRKENKDRIQKCREVKKQSYREYTRRWAEKNQQHVQEYAQKHYIENKQRHLERGEEWRKQNRESDNQRRYKHYVENKQVHDEARWRHYMKRHGMTLNDYENMLSKQDGKCAICGSHKSGKKNSNRLSIDHCHKTGKVRGLLCQQCNLGIGCLKDDITILENALAYLQHAVSQ